MPSSFCITSTGWLIWLVAGNWIEPADIRLGCWRVSLRMSTHTMIQMILVMAVLLISASIMVLYLISHSLLRLSVEVGVSFGVDIGTRRDVSTELSIRIGIAVVAIGPLCIHLPPDPSAVQHQVTRQQEEH